MLKIVDLPEYLFFEIGDPVEWYDHVYHPSFKGVVIEGSYR